MKNKYFVYPPQKLKKPQPVSNTLSSEVGKTGQGIYEYYSKLK